MKKLPPCREPSERLNHLRIHSGQERDKDRFSVCFSYPAVGSGIAAEKNPCHVGREV